VRRARRARRDRCACALQPSPARRDAARGQHGRPAQGAPARGACPYPYP
jgi:hypothetical protein